MDGARDILEFFVTPAYEEQLLTWFDLYIEEGVIFSYRKEPNRLIP